MKNSGGRRRARGWKRFGTRTLFVLVTLFALVFGFWIYPSISQQRVVQELNERGYLVRYDIASDLPTDKLREFIRQRLGMNFLYDVHSVTMWSEADGRVKSEDMEQIKRLGNLRELNLYSGKLKSGDLKQIRELKRLWRLELLIEGITDNDLRDISELNLDQLNLGDLPITNAGVKHLAGMTTLRTLKLDGTNITDQAIGYLSKLPQLGLIGLRGTQITDQGLKQISTSASRESITKLMLYSTNITTTGFQHLPGLPHLRYLDAENTQLDDTALQYIDQLQRLETLKLSFTKVTADGIGGLDLPNLLMLELRGTNIQPNDLIEFQQRHPRCSIRL